MKKLLLLCAFSFFSLAANAADKPLQLTKTNYNEVVASSPYVVIDVYTDWCGPCKYLAPVFQSLHEELGNQYRFVKLNGDQESQLTSSFGISGYPTLIFVKNGKEVGRQVGYVGRDQIINLLTKHFQ